MIEGIQRALATGVAQPLDPFTRARRIDTAAQKQTLGSKSPPDPVHAAGPDRP